MEPLTRPVAVFIMAKAPAAGHVKTRLTPALSAAEACALYRCFLLDKIGQVAALAGATPALAYTPETARPTFEALAPHFLLIPQRGDDLGARLAGAFADLLALGCAGAIAVDSDTPTLPTEFLDRAVRLVADPSVDLVLGPSDDGGYYLIGLDRVHPSLFSNMRWSTSDVLAETMRRAAALGLRVAALPAWFDVDTPEDLERLRAALAESADGGPANTRRFLLGGPG